MSTLKELRLRIKSVKSTQKITSAMKMVASAKLRRAQDTLFKSIKFTTSFSRFTRDVAALARTEGLTSTLLTGHASGVVLIVGIGAHRGLCGSYTTNVAREMRQLANTLKKHGKTPLFFPIGRKLHEVFAHDNFTQDYPTHLLTFYYRMQASSCDVHTLHKTLLCYIAEKEIGEIHLVTGKFKSVLSQPIETRTLLPFPYQETQGHHADLRMMECEPHVGKLLPKVLEINLLVQLQILLIENNVCEQAARMSAMDNASKNARDMIDRLQLDYNQKRQSQITNELIEILAGASAAA